MEADGKYGEQDVGPGGAETLRLGRLGDLIVSELRGRLYEQNKNSRLFAAGMTLTSIANATFTAATLDATATPIAGVWNPADSDVDLEILLAFLGLTITALQATGCGPLVWAVSGGNTLATPTTGKQPTNLKTLNAKGSRAVDVSGAALTGLTNNLRVIRASALGGGSASNAAFLATQVGMQAQAPAPPPEDIAGGIIIPPGGVLALLASSTPVAHSAASGLVWAEVPRAV